jgi:hypothetical protein
MTAIGATEPVGGWARIVPRSSVLRLNRVMGSGISTFAKDRLDIVAVGIKNKSGIVARRATVFHAAVSRRTVIGAACFQCSRVESVHLSAALSCERRVVLGAVRMEAINPENRILDAIADSIATLILGQLLHAAEAERAQSRIVKGAERATSATPMPVWSIILASSVSQRVADVPSVTISATLNLPAFPSRSPMRKSELIVCLQRVRIRS